MEYLNPVHLKRIRVWGKVIGIISMLYGTIFIVLSFILMFVYAFPGLISILIGILFFNLGQTSKRALKSEEKSIHVAEQIAKKYGLLLFCIGILIIISILALVIFFIFI